MNTEQLINEARNGEYELAPYGEKADWLQFAEAHSESGNFVEVEIRSVGNKYTGTKVIRTAFFNGHQRISRKVAEELLAA